MSDSQGTNPAGPIAQNELERNTTPADGGSPPPPGRSDAMPHAIKVVAQGFTDQGRVRKNNEDNLAACDLSSGDVRTGPFVIETTLGERGLLILVADGMGGQACGELASSMCSEQLPARLLEMVGKRPTLDRSCLSEAINQAFEGANRSILDASRTDLRCHGMGTTATAALLHGDYLLVAQVGDSRAYLIRSQQLRQLTRDQTFLNYLVDIGAVEPSNESSADPRRSVLTQALGTAEELQVALTGVELCQGDRLLLASDGLYSMVSDPQILSIAASGNDLGASARSLIATANQRGGADNITVVLAEISGNGLPQAHPGEAIHVEDLGSKI